MLKIHFINVAEGDAILLEYQQGNNVYRILVDDGHAELENVEGSSRNTAVQYLQKLGIHTLDGLVISHFHLDHFGSTALLASKIKIKNVYASYFPTCPGQQIELTADTVKERRKLSECLNLWSQDVQLLVQKGCHLIPVDQDTLISGPKDLEIKIVVPSLMAHEMQKRLFDDLFAQKPISEQTCFWASKSRNPNALRVDVRYAGRRIVLAADCYGKMWENKETESCDILKVPHHGDAKSMTPKLAAVLHPQYAVVCCCNEYIEKKDRPSATKLGLLQKTGTEVFYTDSYTPEGSQPLCWPAAVFTIDEKGAISAPRI